MALNGLFAGNTPPTISAVTGLAPMVLPQTAAPSNPTNGQVWLSNSLQHLIADPYSGSRNTVFDGQEAMPYWEASTNTLHCWFTDGTGYISYRYCTGDPSVSANWSAVQSQLIQTFVHANYYIEGTTMYFYGTTGGAGTSCYTMDITSGVNLVQGNSAAATSASSSGTTITCASTANILVGMYPRVTAGTGSFAAGTKVLSVTDSTHFVVDTTPSVALSGATVATSWMNPQGIVLAYLGFTHGNPCVVKVNGYYHIFQEYLHSDSLGLQGTTTSWQMGRFVANSPLGPFTLAGPGGAAPAGVAVITSLRQNRLNPVWGFSSLEGGSAVSGADIHLENGNYVMYYHTAAWARFFPSYGARAVASPANLIADSWTVLDNQSPFIAPSGEYERDQVADLACITINGVNYLFYSAGTNGGSAFRIVCMPLYPSWRQWDGYRWQPAMPMALGPKQGLSVRPQSPLIQSRDYMDPGLPNVGGVGTWTIDVTTANQMLGGRIYNSSAANGDAIVWAFDTIPGAYSLAIYYDKGPDAGIIFVDHDGGAGDYFQHPVTSLDTYAASATLNQVSTFTFNIYGDVQMQRRFKVFLNSKNASSTGYKAYIHKIVLSRTNIL